MRRPKRTENTPSPHGAASLVAEWQPQRLRGRPPCAVGDAFVLWNSDQRYYPGSCGCRRFSPAAVTRRLVQHRPSPQRRFGLLRSCLTFVRKTTQRLSRVLRTPGGVGNQGPRRNWRAFHEARRKLANATTRRSFRASRLCVTDDVKDVALTVRRPS